MILATVAVTAVACTENPEPEPQNPVTGPSGPEMSPDIAPSDYVTSDWLPHSENIPKAYWDARGVLYQGDKNDLKISDPKRGLQHHLLLQSVAGLMHGALKDGTCDIGIWMGADHEEYGIYESRKALDGMGVQNLGVTDGIELATVTLKDRFSGYVLTDVENNPESNIVASVASHVYNAVIVDMRDKALFDEAGYEMVYDARRKTTAEAWDEFRDKCDNRALVLMPVQTGELREFAIANRLFVINLNHYYADSSRGDNFETFAEVLNWLAPNAPVYGWDQGIDENKIAETISKYGKQSVPYDWGYNTTLTSVAYGQRQDFEGAKSIDPTKIDYSLDKKFVSFYLTDGDNVQWMMGGFDRWYDHPESAEVAMTYGLSVANTSMIGPAQLQALFAKQPENVGVFERCSYFFGDIYASLTKDRDGTVKQLAEYQAGYMNRHGVKILGLVSRNDAGTPESLAYLEEFVKANDSLEGVIVIQYSPYADGQGRVFWFKNSKGWDIPVVCSRYSVWNCGGRNNEFEGTPKYVAGKLLSNTDDNMKHSLICVHCWSKFYDRGTDCGDLEENVANQDAVSWDDPDIVFSAGAAKLTMNHLGPDFRAVTAQELMWRLRMEHNPEQTSRILESYN